MVAHGLAAVILVNTLFNILVTGPLLDVGTPYVKLQVEIQAIADMVSAAG